MRDNAIIRLLKQHVDYRKISKDSFMPRSLRQVNNFINTNKIIFFPFKHNYLKVVILGVEPNPCPGVSNHRAYGVNTVKLTPELKEIQEELLGINTENWQTLEYLENQGVLLYNISPTVRTGESGSHIEFWNTFSVELIKHISLNKPCIWLIWGDFLKDYVKYIHNPFFIENYKDNNYNGIPAYNDRNYVLFADAPGSGNFKGCQHFEITNKILTNLKTKKINWYGK